MRRHPLGAGRPRAGATSTGIESFEQLDGLHAAFARGLAASLSQRFGPATEVAPLGTELVSYHDFGLSLGPDACLEVIRVDPPGAHACLALPRSFLLPMLERAADATVQAQVLAGEIVERAAARLADSWSVSVDVTVTEQTPRPSPLRLMPDDEQVGVTRFDLRLPAGAGGVLSLCLPAPVMRYLRDGSPTSRHRSATSSEDDRSRIRQAVRKATVELSAVVARSTMPLEQALTLSPGDVIPIACATATPLATLCLQGMADRAGVLVRLDGRRAIRVTSPLRDEGLAS